MERIFTSAVMDEVVRRVNGGARACEIARDLGLNLGSLRVKASTLGISLRQRKRERGKPIFPRGEVPLRVRVSKATLAQLREWSIGMGLSTEDLASELLSVIVSDRLCAAILGDFEQPVALARCEVQHDPAGPLGRR